MVRFGVVGRVDECIGMIHPDHGTTWATFALNSERVAQYYHFRASTNFSKRVRATESVEILERTIISCGMPSHAGTTSMQDRRMIELVVTMGLASGEESTSSPTHPSTGLSVGRRQFFPCIRPLTENCCNNTESSRITASSWCPSPNQATCQSVEQRPM